MAEIADKLISAAPVPGLGPGPNAHGAPPDILAAHLDAVLRECAGDTRALRSAALIWHGHLDAAHEIAQDLPGPDGSLLHAIIHRMEPDYANANYWLNRAGDHPVFPVIAGQIRPLLERQSAGRLPAPLLREGRWDPRAFIAVCETALRNRDAGLISFLTEIQAVELKTLIAHLAA